ncbi:kinase-like domain-containing protein [Gigaspora rosea]|uniref:Kinase-like domain-containing protein n=1 Tax=Gigaspora rosea TaxID=44941 RepID=A0A397VH94_9GLOM|nr:kinase-like domain-containing protein [Gigaspora rosea]
MSKDINCNDAETIKHENSNDILDYIKELGELATGDETLSKYSGILVKFLTEQKVKCFDFRSSSDLKYIGKGSFSTVSSVIFEGRIYALKSLNNNIQMNKTQLKQFTRELMNLYEANHANIIKLHGISRGPMSSNFMLVLQFANGGTLFEYLGKMRRGDLYQISWNILIRTAKGITNGLTHLHKNGVIHRDLHSKNILIHDDEALIADFGLSKRNDELSTSTNNNYCAVGYTDPLFLLQGTKRKRDDKSDIYSLGVLLWELTSGIPPFHDLPIFRKIIQISNNIRPNIVDGTPPAYSDMFIKCWSAEPNDRPSLNEISRKLENLSTESIEFITNKITHNQIETEQHDSKSLDQEHNRANNSSINNNSFTDVVDNETIGNPS